MINTSHIVLINDNNYVVSRYKRQGVKVIEVVEADIDNATYLALKKEIEEVDFKPYEAILTTSEDDEFVKILIKSTPKKIKEIVVISLYSDEINVVRCKGNLKSDMLEKSKTN